MSIRKYKFNTRELLAQVNENELIIKEKYCSSLTKYYFKTTLRLQK